MEVCRPKSRLGITVEPQPDWTLDDLISELNALELKLNDPLLETAPSAKTKIPYGKFLFLLIYWLLDAFCLFVCLFVFLARLIFFPLTTNT